MLKLGRYVHLLARCTNQTSSFARTLASGGTDITKPFRQIRDGLSWTIPKDLQNSDRPPGEVDVLIIGGGAMGSSIAYFLKAARKAGVSVAVVERDSGYSMSSTVLSVGSIRQQFSTPENIYMSMYSAQFIKNVQEHLQVEGSDPPDLQFNDQGYLFLATNDKEHILHENHIIQKNCGAKVELMTQNQLKKRFPWMNTDNVTLGSYGLENEGWLDPWSLLKSFKEKAIDLGAKYYNAEVTGFNVVDDDANPIDPTQFAPNGRRLNSVMVSMINSPEVVEVKSSYVVLTAGAWSGQLGKLLGIGTGPKEENLHMPIPVEPRKRYVYFFHCPEGPGLECPLLIDPSGSYVRREGFGGNYLCGKSPNECDEPSCEDLNVNYDFFDTEIWPNLAHRIPVMEKLKVKSAWAGYYDYNCLDQNAIIGSHPAYGNFLMATGFSGHGIQQSPAVGKLVSEKILAGEFQTIDVSKFGFERCITETPVLERCVI